jgi:hypothetical protein
MTFSRKRRSGLAMVGINLDEAPDDKVMDEIRAMDLVESAWYLELPELPSDDVDKD